MDATPTYSVENGMNFGWSSVTGDLNPDRVAHLRRYLLGKTVLDAGCGGGAFVEHLCANGFRVTGLDYHAEFLDVARTQATSLGTYIQGDITAMPFADKEFDSAYCYDVLEHVDDRLALRELLRVTRQRLILAVPAKDNSCIGHGLTFRHYQDLTHLRTYTCESLENLCKETGQKHFQIFPELPVDLRGTAQDFLEAGAVNSSVRVFARRVYHKMLRWLLARARYRLIYSGWVAVIDVENLETAAPCTDAAAPLTPGPV